MVVIRYLHFYSLHLDAPWIGGLVESLLHHVADGLTLRKDFSQVLCAQNVSQSCCSQQMCGMAGENQK